MEIPLNTKVACSDGECGESAFVIVDPRMGKVSHLVVRDSDGEEHLVPVEVIIETRPDRILIRLSRAELSRVQPFIKETFLPGTTPFLSYPQGGYLSWPAAAPGPVPVETHLNPPGTVEISKGARVEALDGEVGKVDELLIDPVSMQITHVILREGSLWQKRDITIPVGEILRIEPDAIYLKLSKDQIAHLPAANP